MIQTYAAKQAGQPLEPFEYDPGALQPDEVEIDVLHCGLCHSDVSIVNNDWGITQFPVVPGHEVVGRIGKKGEAVRNLEVGQHVGLGWHAGFCGACGYCATGDHNLCAAPQETIVGHHGGFADKVRARAHSVVPLPDGLDFTAVGPLFCGGITVFNPFMQFGIEPTDRVGVIGIGGLGHLALQFASKWGCEVTAFTSDTAKEKEAKAMGAHHVIHSRDPKAVEAAAGSFDLIISTVNVKLDWNLYVNALKPRGRLHFVGATLEPLDLQIFPLLIGQRSVSGSPVGSPATIATMLEFCKRHNILPVVEHFKFSQVNDAIKKLKQGNVRYRAVLSH
ncbi:putative alcohol dehydrogenase, Zn-dependent and NAD(P)-binding [Nitrospina gracilis 3/211]|uniref:alcohol dehydrogenase (NADP(+)) n=1 Tax=Nitrospina gracilis (strain 3/211) TaxID=1266370 RepID=M1YVK4_NITG3|nr:MULTISPECIES: NAD(P)-dependent alcohol dehydrogenase [Nitrospina]MCF8722688.1 putative zinc-type alcohol dehydrogenase-like protein [Nitrospina sp. Nb-3]CCQ89630.1 putative alcohol dehydrogenase, Zn-dependent and NAD(P)-binding [Nitrospina gracilis 3/211]